MESNRKYTEVYESAKIAITTANAHVPNRSTWVYNGGISALHIENSQYQE